LGTKKPPNSGKFWCLLLSSLNIHKFGALSLAPKRGGPFFGPIFPPLKWGPPFFPEGPISFRFVCAQPSFGGDTKGVSLGRISHRGVYPGVFPRKGALLYKFLVSEGLRKGVTPKMPRGEISKGATRSW